MATLGVFTVWVWTLVPAPCVPFESGATSVITHSRRNTRSLLVGLCGLLLASSPGPIAGADLDDYVKQHDAVFSSGLLRWFGQGLLTTARTSYRQRLFVEHDLDESSRSTVDVAPSWVSMD